MSLMASLSSDCSSAELSDHSADVSGRTLVGVTEPPFPAPDLRLRSLELEVEASEEDDDDVDEEVPDPNEGGSDLEGEFFSLVEPQRRLGLSLRFLTNFNAMEDEDERREKVERERRERRRRRRRGVEQKEGGRSRVKWWEICLSHGNFVEVSSVETFEIQDYLTIYIMSN